MPIHQLIAHQTAVWQIVCCMCVLTLCLSASLSLLPESPQAPAADIPYLAVRPSHPRSCAHTVPCRDWEVVGSQISLSPSQVSKISVDQSLLVATVTFKAPISCDGSKTLTVDLGG